MLSTKKMSPKSRTNMIAFQRLSNSSIILAKKPVKTKALRISFVNGLIVVKSLLDRMDNLISFKMQRMSKSNLCDHGNQT